MDNFINLLSLRKTKIVDNNKIMCGSGGGWEQYKNYRTRHIKVLYKYLGQLAFLNKFPILYKPNHYYLYQKYVVRITNSAVIYLR